MSKKIKALIIGLFLFLPLPILALAVHNDSRVIIEKDQVVEGNLYIAAETVEIYGAVNGDIFAIAAKNIYIDSDNINGDIFAISETVNIRGDINGTARVLASNVLIPEARLKNLMAAGEDVRISKESDISRHFSFAAQNVTVAGPVGGKVEGLANDFILDNTVGGDVDLYIGFEEDRAGLRLTDEAAVNGKLYYKSLKEFELNQNASLAGGVVHNQVVKQEESIKDKINPMGKLIEFFGLMVVGMVFIYLAPRYLHNMYKRAKKHYIRTFFRGFAFLVLTPLLCILLGITIIGFPLALIALALWFIGIYLAQVMLAWLLGSFINDKIIKNKKSSPLLALAIGIIAMMILSFIPYVGFIILTIAYLMAWGVFYDTFYKLLKKK